MRLLFLNVVLCLVSSTLLFGQQSAKYTGNYANYFRAEELYTKSQFSAAKKVFREFISSSENEEDPFLLKAYYFESLCALELRNYDAIELIESFNKKFPENIYYYDLIFRVAKDFYQRKSFKKAQKWFLLVPPSEISSEEKDEYYFKLGYSALNSKKTDLAYQSFREIKDGMSPYSLPSLYFFSHISYERGANQLALEGFLRLQKDSVYCGIVPYYLAQIYHRQEKYNEVIELGPTVLKCSFLNNESDINHLIGNAFYKLKKYPEAIPYLEYYSSNSKPSRSDNYELGYSYFKSGDYEKALRQFDKVTRSNDSMTQIALYQIGECYMKQNKMLPARSAFDQASEMSHLPEIQEDALYNFAVISFNVDINPYNESVRAFESFLKKYPNSSKRKDVYQYLLNVYTNSSDFSNALMSIKRLPDLDIQMKKVYQTVAFNYGVDLFNKKRFSNAIVAFKEVSTFPVDPEKMARAKYWTADIHMRMSKESLAIETYKEFINSPASNSMPEKADAYYNIGYAYLKLNDLKSAIESFRNYLQFNPNNSEKIVDAHFRIADCYYVREDEGDNLLAIEYYSKTAKLNSTQTDKALYYLSKSYGYNGDANKKIETLIKLINEYSSSAYLMNARFDLGWAYLSIKDYENSLNIFNEYLNNHQTSQYKIQVKLAIADIYFKLGNYQKSEIDFNDILNEYSNIRDVCAAAVNGLIEIYKSTNRLNEAAEIADQYSCAEISLDEKENIFYVPSIEAYNKNEYSTAIPLFETYLEKFPNGRFANESFYYLGHCQYLVGDTLNAISNFEKYLEFPYSENSNKAALATANYYYTIENYASSLTYFEYLDQIATQPSDQIFAKTGVAKSAFYIQNYEKSAAAAKGILDIPGISKLQQKDAHYIYGVSKFNLEEFEAALTSLEWLVKNITSVWGSEAKYLIAEIYYKSGQQEESIAQIKALLRIKPSYNYWVAKGLLLQARNEIILERLFEAETNINSVIDHYPIDDDGILEEALKLRDEMMLIKNAEKTIEEEPEKRIEIND